MINNSKICNEKTSEKSEKTLTQQMFHKAMFTNRPRSSSISGYPSTSQQSSEIINVDLDSYNKSDTDENKDSWMEVEDKRKRPRSSPETSGRQQKQSKPNTYWLSQPITTSNSFSQLDLEETLDLKDKVNKSTKPPPIFVDKVNNIQPLIDLLNTHAKQEYEIKILSNNQVKIQTKFSEVYTRIVKELDVRETEYYTYKPKQERGFKVVL